MEQQRSGITKWLLVGLAAILFWQVGLPLITGKGKAELQPLKLDDSLAPLTRAEQQNCEIQGDKFRAVLSTRGGSLTHYEITDTARYQAKAPMPDGVLAGIAATFSPDFGKGAGPLQLVTTTHENLMPLRTDLRAPGMANPQISFDDVDYKLASQDGKSCVFVHEERRIDAAYAAMAAETDPAKREAIQKQIDDASKNESELAVVGRVTKTISATGNAYELAVDVKVENLGAEPRKHRLTVEQSSWRTNKETQGSLGRQSDWATETVTGTSTTTDRKGPSDFKPGDFKDKEFTPEKWRRSEGEGKWAAISASFMTNMVVAIEAPAAPSAEMRVEEVWNTAFPDKAKDPNYGHVYRARLNYPERELKQGESVSYKLVAFAGPKERALLDKLGHNTLDVINLRFAFIGKALIRYLYFLHDTFTHSWGWAICLMTITLKLVLFPLSIGQIKSSAVMRRLKPEIDALNEQYKDDTTQRGLALQELYRKHGVNPVVGCLPMLLQMPVWFAVYAALQTAVEFYMVPFGPFIPDLSSPGKYFIIPAVLGLSSFTQQKLMPAQGDPAQQKMMLYMMPGIFTVMMLFLPAGLGVYMLTNTWLGILQQVLVERYLKSRAHAAGTGITVKEKTDGGDKPKGDSGNRRQLLERGKARG
ncbi:MAG: YidC/Oxa1 family insertase periplasmic-domain containing protein [Polyangiaceae bacterium]